MNSAGKILRVGLIGAGWVTQHHLAAWKKRADAKVVAVCDPDAGNARKRAVEFDIENVFGDAREMLDGTSLDAVDIASPRETHPEMVLLAAAHGVAILCQKPFAPTLAAAETVAAGLPAQQRIMVHENWRFRPYYRQVKQWLTEEAVGTPLQCCMTLFSSGMLPDANGIRPLLHRQPFMRTLDRMLVMEVLIHHLDTLRFLLGPLEVKDAKLARSTDELIGEDAATITLCTGSGARVMLMANVAAAGYPAALVDRLTIIGDGGSISRDGPDLRIAGSRTAVFTYDLAETYQQSYAAAIGHFVDCLQSGADFETRPADNLETLRVVESIYAIASR
jgi:predicted dehydrogenase